MAQENSLGNESLSVCPHTMILRELAGSDITSAVTPHALFDSQSSIYTSGLEGGEI